MRTEVKTLVSVLVLEVELKLSNSLSQAVYETENCYVAAVMGALAY